MDDLKRLFDMRENALTGLRAETKTAIREDENRRSRGNDK